MSHTIYLLSGGVGASGEQLVRTVLAQFPESDARLAVVPHVRYRDQIDHAVASARDEGATLVYTMVDPELRKYLEDVCAREGICAIDLMGGLIERLEEQLGRSPLGQPGLYRKLHRDYFERVAAIEYAMTHDDGRDPQGWRSADILLVGISRVGKTPLSLYLSVLGWKVANYPLVPGIDPPGVLSEIDVRRIVGLTIEPGQLVTLRQERQRRMGAPGSGSYTDPETVFDEVELARKLYKRRGFTVIDVTDKPIETTADEVIRLMTGRFDPKGRRG